jgi:hypothetical protein
VVVHCASGPPQICSPIMEISTSKPHDEHFIVGIKLDSLGIPAIFATAYHESNPELSVLIQSSHAAARWQSSCIARG